MGKLFKNKNIILSVSWLAILLYAVASTYLLIASLQWVQKTPAAYLKPETLIAYAITSFLLVALVSVVHLASLIRRRRRRSDRLQLSRAKFLRAKHRRSRKGK
jgi:hypothetical protein